MIIDSAKYTCPGGHEINEDSCLCRGDKGIFIVADGLGGHSSGEKASGTAIEYFEQNCTGGYTNESISALLEGANTQVLQYGDGGKTTVAAAFVENGNFIYANAGDSRVYYFREGKIIAQTKDHSVCQASVDMGMMRPEDIRGSEDRSRLLKVLGGEEKLAIKKHYQPIRIRTGDAFLICSDGFWDYVYETEMEADLLKSGSADVWLKYMLKRHILRAQNKGDNYTAICGIIHIEEGDVFENLPVSNKPSKSVPQVERKKFPLKIVILAAVAVLLAAAAIVLGIMLLGGNGGEQPEISSVPVETVSESEGFIIPDTTTQENATNTTDPEETETGTEETENSEDAVTTQKPEDTTREEETEPEETEPEETKPEETEPEETELEEEETEPEETELEEEETEPENIIIIG